MEPQPTRPALDTSSGATPGEALTFVDGVRRQIPYWATVTKRTWRGSVVSSFLSPLLYVVAMGVVLGGFVEGDPDRLEGATSYLAFVVPGLIAAHAMQTAVSETTYPVMGMIKWQRVYESMLATPLQVPQVVAAHLLFVTARLVVTCTVFTLVLAPFGVFESWWGPPLAVLSQVLVGVTFATLVYGFSARLRNEEGFGVLFRLGVFPLFLFSGAFFPVTNLGEAGAWAARLTPLWHGVNLSRMFALDHVTWWLAGVNVAVLVLLALVGWRWSVTGLQRRMVS
ncbi:ABC transporter permease [Nocardioides ferulae]|uniref:ABC transporter permease n=1 Tax=Nocardioides ferulae TaxID=2340821 RepID=UPI000EACDC4C|nr:ABC transporter permease [Nocardioides ferulae]